MDDTGKGGTEAVSLASHRNFTGHVPEESAGTVLCVLIIFEEGGV